MKHDRNPFLARRLAQIVETWPVHPDAPALHVRRALEAAGFRESTFGALPPAWSDEPEGRCIEWGHRRSKQGQYGQVSIARGTSPWVAHRLAYVVWVGPIPPGYEVDHLCGNPLCWRPNHLEAVTAEEHSKRTKRRQRLRAFPEILRTTEINRDDGVYERVELGSVRGYGREIEHVRAFGRRTAGRDGRQAR